MSSEHGVTSSAHVHEEGPFLGCGERQGHLKLEKNPILAQQEKQLGGLAFSSDSKQPCPILPLVPRARVFFSTFEQTKMRLKEALLSNQQRFDSVPSS